MGISLLHAEFIVREHRYRPLPETVHLIGRQTVLFSYEQALALLRRHGIQPTGTEVKLDHTTRGAQVRITESITDETFFRLLGVRDVRAVDHSNYEGADIILNLNQPIPDRFAQSAEFVFGGSVLDNIFDPAMYLRNLALLLKPGGRLIEANVASFNHHPYIVVSPAWLLDFFVANAFADCKVYFVQTGRHDHLYGLQPGSDDDLIADMGNAPVCTAFGTVVVAEKSRCSSHDRMPSQDQYREHGEWALYRDNYRAVKEASRPWWTFSDPTDHELHALRLRSSGSFRYLGVHRATAEEQTPYSGSLTDRPSQATGIRVLEASYGLNVMGHGLRPAVMPVCDGNVTQRIAELFNGKDACDWTVDVNYLGDPAPGMPKDLQVIYYHVEDQMKRLCQITVPAEAHGKALRLPPLRAGQ